jgi:RNA ligase
MNKRQQEIYANLMLLVQTNDAFFFQDCKRDDATFRIFNYRLASYTDFLAPDAMEARGIMFEVVGETAIRLAAWPMQKFFNINECPLTMGLDLSTIESISNKADGSLISTYLHNGDVYLKSKGALFSDQAVAAMHWLDQPENTEFKNTLKFYAESEYTINLEWCSPENRIVIGYEKPKLVVLNIRRLRSGTYNTTYPEVIQQHLDPPVNLNGLSPEEFVNQVPDMLDNIEGFVVKLKSGLWFKVKTDKYKSLHHCKDSVNNPRRLFEVIIDEGIDDIRDMFKDDALLMKQIGDMQYKVNHIYNSMIVEVENFYNENHKLDRKDFAIKAKSSVTPLYFGHVMNLYQGKSVDYKAWMKKSWRAFGLKDEYTPSVID